MSPSTKIGLIIGTGALILGGIFIYLKTKKNHPDSVKIQNLRKQIKLSFQIAQPSLCPLTQEKSKTLKDNNLEMNITFISKLENKSKLTVSSTKNPFLPPFEKGIMITELPPKHRLLYNKFYFYKNHLLVTTQEFEDQKNRVNIEDLKQVLLAMEAVKGLFFFNSGPESGYSQNHKHVQVLPQEALRLPIVSRIIHDIDHEKLTKIHFSNVSEQIYNFDGYKFIHGLIPMEERTKEQSFEDSALEFKKCEEALLHYLTKTLKNESLSYNIIGCTKFLLIIPRKCEKVMGCIDVNAIGFMGSMLTKNIQDFEQIEYLYKPTDILRSLTYTELPK